MISTIKMSPLILMCIIVMASPSSARDVTIGRTGTVQFTWAGEPLRTVDQNTESPFHCEILTAERDGDETTYVLAYTILEPGIYDLKNALLNMVGQPVEGLPSIEVSTESLLPEDYDGELLKRAIVPPPDFWGFSPRMFAAAVLWVLAGGVALRLSWPRKPEAVETVASRGPTVAEMLKPFLEKASAGTLTASEKVAMTLIFIRFWQVKLSLKEMNPDKCIERLRRHDQAGKLLECLDRLFYSEKPVEPKELETILGPYEGTFACDVHLEDLT